MEWVLGGIEGEVGWYLRRRVAEHYISRQVCRRIDLLLLCDSEWHLGEWFSIWVIMLDEAESIPRLLDV